MRLYNNIAQNKGLSLLMLCAVCMILLIANCAIKDSEQKQAQQQAEADEERRPLATPAPASAAEAEAAAVKRERKESPYKEHTASIIPTSLDTYSYLHDETAGLCFLRSRSYRVSFRGSDSFYSRLHREPIYEHIEIDCEKVLVLKQGGAPAAGG